MLLGGAVVSIWYPVATQTADAHARWRQFLRKYGCLKKRTDAPGWGNPCWVREMMRYSHSMATSQHDQDVAAVKNAICKAHRDPSYRCALAALLRLGGNAALAKVIFNHDEARNAGLS